MQDLLDFDQREIRRMLARKVSKCLKNDSYAHHTNIRMLGNRNKINALLKVARFKFAPGLFRVLTSLEPIPDFFQQLPGLDEHDG